MDPHPHMNFMYSLVGFPHRFHGSSSRFAQNYMDPLIDYMDPLTDFMGPPVDGDP